MFNAEVSKKFKVISLGLLVLLNVILRIPSIPHAKGRDAFSFILLPIPLMLLEKRGGGNIGCLCLAIIHIHMQVDYLSLFLVCHNF